MNNRRAVSKILDSQWEWIEDSKRLSSHVFSHLNVIRKCRTEAMGGHLYCCENCGKVHKRYHSCRNRHCPNCQHTQRERCERQRLSELPEGPYYHVVFTSPASLNEIAIAYQRQVEIDKNEK